MNVGLTATLFLLFCPLLAFGAPGTLKVAICSEGYAPLIMRSLDGSYYGYEVDQVRLEMDVCCEHNLEIRHDFLRLEMNVCCKHTSEGKHDVFVVS